LRIRRILRGFITGGSFHLTQKWTLEAEARSEYGLRDVFGPGDIFDTYLRDRILNVGIWGKVGIFYQI
jgi:hypothetical protein